MKIEVVKPSGDPVSFDEIMEFVKQFRKDAIRIGDEFIVVIKGTAVYTDFESYVDILLKSVDTPPQEDVSWYIHITREGVSEA